MKEQSIVRTDELRIQNEAENRKKDNFAHWKSTVGLPTEFPSLDKRLQSLELLSSVDLMSQIYETGRQLQLGNAHREQIETIREVLGNKSVAVVVEPGQGCTTLRDTVFEIEDGTALRKRHIPIRFDIEDGFKGKRHVDEKFRKQVAWFLSRQHFWRVTGDYHASKILGAGTEPHIKWDDFSGYQQKLLFSPGASWESIKDKFPTLNGPLYEALGQFEYKGGMMFRPVLFVDLSSPNASQNEVSRAEKIRRANAVFTDIPKSPGVTYFGSAASLEALGIDFDHTVEYPPYSPADVFAILSKRYVPDSGHLGNVLDPEIVERIASQKLPLREISRQVKAVILNGMSDYSKLPYKIR